MKHKISMDISRPVKCIEATAGNGFLTPNGHGHMGSSEVRQLQSFQLEASVRIRIRLRVWVNACAIMMLRLSRDVMSCVPLHE